MMERIQTLTFWLGLAYGVIGYGLLGMLFLLSPEAINNSGIGFETAHGSSVVRVSMGAPLISLSLVSILGIIRPRYALLCLLIVTAFTAVIVLARLYAIGADGSEAQNLTELSEEGGSLVFLLIALWCGRNRIKAWLPE